MNEKDAKKLLKKTRTFLDRKDWPQAIEHANQGILQLTGSHAASADAEGERQHSDDSNYANGASELYMFTVFLAVSLAGMHEVEEAKKAYEQAISIDPVNTLAYKGIIRLLGAEAYAWIERLLEIIGNDVESDSNANTDEYYPLLLEAYCSQSYYKDNRKKNAESAVSAILHALKKVCNSPTGRATLPMLAKVIAAVDFWIDVLVGEGRHRLGAPVLPVLRERERERMWALEEHYLFRVLLDHLQSCKLDAKRGGGGGEEDSGLCLIVDGLLSIWWTCGSAQLKSSNLGGDLDKVGDGDQLLSTLQSICKHANTPIAKYIDGELFAGAFAAVEGGEYPALVVDGKHAIEASRNLCSTLSTLQRLNQEMDAEHAGEESAARSAKAREMLALCKHALALTRHYKHKYLTAMASREQMITLTMMHCLHILATDGSVDCDAGGRADVWTELEKIVKECRGWVKVGSAEWRKVNLLYIQTLQHAANSTTHREIVSIYKQLLEHRNDGAVVSRESVEWEVAIGWHTFLAAPDLDAGGADECALRWLHDALLHCEHIVDEQEGGGVDACKSTILTRIGIVKCTNNKETGTAAALSCKQPFIEALHLNPQNALAYFWAAKWFATIGDWQRVLKCARKCVGVDGSLVGGALLLAACWLEDLGKDDVSDGDHMAMQVIKLLHPFSVLYSGNHQVWLLLAIAYECMHQSQKSINAYQSCIKCLDNDASNDIIKPFSDSAIDDTTLLACINRSNEGKKSSSICCLVGRAWLGIAHGCVRSGKHGSALLTLEKLSMHYDSPSPSSPACADVGGSGGESVALLKGRVLYAQGNYAECIHTLSLYKQCNGRTSRLVDYLLVKACLSQAEYKQLPMGALASVADSVKRALLVIEEGGFECDSLFVRALCEYFVGCLCCVGGPVAALSLTSNKQHNSIDDGGMGKLKGMLAAMHSHSNETVRTEHSRLSKLIDDAMLPNDGGNGDECTRTLIDFCLAGSLLSIDDYATAESNDLDEGDDYDAVCALLCIVKCLHYVLQKAHLSSALGNNTKALHTTALAFAQKAIQLNPHLAAPWLWKGKLHCIALLLGVGGDDGSECAWAQWSLHWALEMGQCNGSDDGCTRTMAWWQLAVLYGRIGERHLERECLLACGRENRATDASHCVKSSIALSSTLLLSQQTSLDEGGRFTFRQAVEYCALMAAPMDTCIHALYILQNRLYAKFLEGDTFENDEDCVGAGERDRLYYHLVCYLQFTKNDYLQGSQPPADATSLGNVALGLLKALSRQQARYSKQFINATNKTFLFSNDDNDDDSKDIEESNINDFADYKQCLKAIKNNPDNPEAMMVAAIEYADGGGDGSRLGSEPAWLLLQRLYRDHCIVGDDDVKDSDDYSRAEAVKRDVDDATKWNHQQEQLIPPTNGDSSSSHCAKAILKDWLNIRTRTATEECRLLIYNKVAIVSMIWLLDAFGFGSRGGQCGDVYELLVGRLAVLQDFEKAAPFLLES